MQKVKVKTRLIETEKQQLMLELGDINEKLVVALRDVTNLRVDLGAFNDQLRDALHQNDVLKFRNTELLEELKALARQDEGGPPSF